MKLLSSFKISLIILIITNLSGFLPKNQYNNELNFVTNTNKYAKIIKPVKVDILNTGNPYITNFNFNIDEQIWSITQDDEGVILFAYKKGIILFNGSHLQEISTNNIPLIIKPLNKNNIILVGCNNDYGYLKKNNKGKYQYHSLATEKINIGEISEIKINNNSIFFYSDKALIQLNKSNLSFQNSWISNENEKFFGIVQFNDKIFLNKEEGLYLAQDDSKLKLTNKSNYIAGKKILFDIYFRKSQIIIGTENNKLYIFDGKKINIYNTSAQEYIEESNLVSAVNISYDLFAISTLSGGAVIINKNVGEIVNTINYNTGLPDDEVFAINKDNQGSLWISHGVGISRINYNIPIKDFNSYPGIEGKIVGLENFDNTIFVATTQGLFYLDTVSNLKEIEIYTKKQVAVEENENINKKVFQRWIKKDKRKNKKTDKKDTKTKKTINLKTTYIKQKAYKQTLNYIFKKVKTINSKCKQLIVNEDEFLIATNTGLYEVENRKSKIILKNVYVNQIYKSSINGVYFIATNNGLISIKKTKKKWEINKKIQPKDFNNIIYSLLEDKNHNLWLGGDNVVYKFILDNDLKTKSIEEYKIKSEIPDKISVKKIKNKIYFISSNKIYEFNSKLNKININKSLLKDSTSFSNHIIGQNNISWFKQNNKWNFYSNVYEIESDQISLLSLFDNIQNIKVDYDRSLWIIDGNNQLFKMLPIQKNISFMKDFNVFIEEIHDEAGNLLSLKNANLEYEHSSLTFKINAPFYLKKGGIKYQYYVKGVMKSWTEWRDSPELEFLVGNPGKYRLNIRAKNIFGNISPSKEVIFNIKSPIWMKTWFILSFVAFIIIFSIIIVILIIKKRERKLLREKRILEEKVQERTIEISRQKEEIQLKNIEITDSINYARQIQKAVIPPISILENSAKEYFLINMPKNIVSGDYYWICKKDDLLVVAVADCTGHGVPGAFLSMLGISFLNEITNKRPEFKPNLILEELRYKIISSLHQSGVEAERKDGMDIALSVFDFKNKKVQFSGAYNPLYLIRDNELTVFKADRMPIGVHAKSDKAFTYTEFDLLEGDSFYMFSDGFIDQFGGENGRKFLSSNFQSMLLQIQDFDMETQKNIILTTFDNWKAGLSQLDDILIVGLRF
ncbi:MAG: SpoIIE family protein phosphatase [Bacteroidales bacterium]|nr:SpoIIE family protein phosphatase [Bacteroidales bacterium]MBN2757412.1 SpoIIE family protein phosphatase [Bacteroidales bacterium]